MAYPQLNMNHRSTVMYSAVNLTSTGCPDKLLHLPFELKFFAKKKLSWQLALLISTNWTDIYLRDIKQFFFSKTCEKLKSFSDPNIKPIFCYMRHSMKKFIFTENQLRQDACLFVSNTEFATYQANFFCDRKATIQLRGAAIYWAPGRSLDPRT